MEIEVIDGPLMADPSQSTAAVFWNLPRNAFSSMLRRNACALQVSQYFEKEAKHTFPILLEDCAGAGRHLVELSSSLPVGTA